MGILRYCETVVAASPCPLRSVDDVFYTNFVMQSVQFNTNGLTWSPETSQPLVRPGSPFGLGSISTKNMQLDSSVTGGLTKAWLTRSSECSSGLTRLLMPWTGLPFAVIAAAVG